ncbi:uncharacterized protein LOC142238431 [Haematobia irritans]
MQLLSSSTSNKLLLWGLLFVGHSRFIVTALECYHCEGADCEQMDQGKVDKCPDGETVCATIFNEGTIIAKGCLGNITEDIRIKCQGNNIDILNQCHKCKDDLCNEWSPNNMDLECIQCDSKLDPKCRIEGEPLYMDPTHCHISRIPNILCYALKEGNRTVRGCASTLEQQRTCMASDGCYLCNPNTLPVCNALIPKFEDAQNPNTNAGGIIGVEILSYISMVILIVRNHFL